MLFFFQDDGMLSSLVAMLANNDTKILELTLEVRAMV